MNSFYLAKIWLHTLRCIVTVLQYIRRSFNFSSASLYSPENVLYWAPAQDLITQGLSQPLSDSGV